LLTQDINTFLPACRTVRDYRVFFFSHRTGEIHPSKKTPTTGQKGPSPQAPTFPAADFDTPSGTTATGFYERTLVLSPWTQDFYVL